MIVENILDNNIDEHFYSENRDDRVKETAEVFTPDWLVQEMLDSLSVDWDNIPDDETFIDPTCGSGNFLVALAKRGVPLKNIYGVDLMEDNVQMTKDRLTQYYKDSMSPEGIESHLGRNIICADTLTYHYEFYWHKTEVEKGKGIL